MTGIVQEEEIKLTDVIDRNFLQKFQDVFSKTIGMGVGFADKNGPVTEPGNFTGFCRNYIRGTEEGCKRCRECDLKCIGMSAQTGKTCIQYCHAGLVSFAVPIIVNNKYLGSILGGQILTQKPDEEQFISIARDLGIKDEDGFIEALRKINIISSEQVEATVELLSMVANSISEIADKNLKLIEKAKRDSLVNKVFETLRQSLDINIIKKTIVEEIGKTLQADICFMATYDKTAAAFTIDEYSEYRSSPNKKTYVNVNFHDPKFKWFVNAFRNNIELNIPNIDEFIISNNLKGTPEESFAIEYNLKSSYDIRIFYANDLLGYIIVQYTDNYRTLDENEIAFLRTISTQAGTALHQAKLYSATKQQAEKEALLRNITETIRNEIDSEQIKRQFVEITGNYFNADRCLFADYDPKTNTFSPPKMQILKNGETKNFIIEDENSLSEFTKKLKMGKSTIVRDVEKTLSRGDFSHHKALKTLHENGVLSDYGIPVKYKDQPLGVLILHFTKEKKVLTHDEFDFLKVLRDQVGIALYQNWLFEKERKTAENERILRRVMLSSSSTFNFEEIINSIVTETGKMLKADRCFFIEYNPMTDSHFPVKEYAEYLSSEKIKSHTSRFTNKEEVASFLKFTKQRNIVIVEDINKIDLPEATRKMLIDDLKVKAYAIFPVLYGTTKLGSIVLHYVDNFMHLTQDEIDMAKLIADQTAIIINQTKLYSKINQQSEREKAILSNLPFLAWLKDANGRFLAVNALFAKQCNTTIDGMIGKTDFDFHPKNLAKMYVADDIKVMKTGQQTNVEEKIAGLDGIKWYETFKTPVFDEDGKVIGTTGFSIDITERKEVDRIKNEFVSMVSHELRTPLTSIRGALGLIAGSSMIEGLPEKAKELLYIANNNSLRLINLINDILDIEKIEAGKMDFNIEALDLMPIIEQSIQVNSQYARKFNVNLELGNSLDEVKVKVDKSRLIQVITNLLSNAIKFSNKNSSVRISVLRADNNIRVSITNYGSEIPKEFHNKIFQKFAQADSSDSRQKGGTGLGLSISKAIIEKMNGHISFISQNRETVFYFDLPEFTEYAPVITDRQDASQPNILICEDDRDVALLISMLLNRENYATDIAYSAEQAKKLLAERDYDAMTLDLILPDEDGISLIKKLRENKKTENLPIIVISIKAKEGAETLDGHFAVIDWIDKPIKSDRLLGALKLAVSTNNLDKPRILHVEDDLDVRKITHSVLENNAYVSQVTNLKDAKEALKKENFDLLLLDLELPDGNGAELLSLLNKNEKKKIITVIFSAHNINKDIAEQVDAVLLKSDTSNDDLLQIVNLIKQRKCSQNCG